jgi:hypothetical protein
LHDTWQKEKPFNDEPSVATQLHLQKLEDYNKLVNPTNHWDGEYGMKKTGNEESGDYIIFFHLK